MGSPRERSGWLDATGDLGNSAGVAPGSFSVRRLSAARVAVFGHPVLDRYLYGVTHRISREAPVLIVREESEALYLGGAGNTAANLAGLGASTFMVGPRGDDREGAQLTELFEAQGVDARGLLAGTAASTVTKTRVLAGGLHTTRQQMLRIDRESDEPPSEAACERLLEAALSTLDHVDAVIVSDYGEGALLDVWLPAARAARQRGLPVVADSRHSIMRFEGVSAVTPNEPEAEAALGLTIRTPARALDAARALRERLGLDAALLTRGKEGMVVATADGAEALPAVGGDAVDVTGAGDTVAATLAAGLAVGAPTVEAAWLANLAASVVVQKTGTVAISLSELDAAAEAHR